MPRKLAQKLLLSLTLIVVIVAAVSGLLNVKAEERQLLNAMIVGADQLSNAVTSATWHSMLADRREDAYRIMETIARKQGIDRIRMYNRAGQIMFSTNPEDRGRRPEIRDATCQQCHAPGRNARKIDLPSRVRLIRHSDGRRNLAMVTPIYNEPSCTQAECHAHPASMKVLGVLDLSLKLDAVDREIAAVKTRGLLTMAVEVLLISIFIAYFTSRFLSRPIHNLIESATAISHMDLDKPIQVSHSSEELDTLASSFVTMRDRLREALAEINAFTQNLESKVEERTRQLQAARQKLQQSDRLASLGQLAASVAHEINNPLSGVLNLSMLMQRILREDGIPAGRLPEFRKYLGLVVSETQRVGRIVSDLLAFSRRSTPQRALADLNRLVSSTCTLVSHKLKLGNIEVELWLDEKLPSVFCDASQIQQVVLNLVLNAAESMQARGHGRIWIATALADGGESAILKVSDNGEGIREENLARIFDPFFTTKSDAKGVGLGLAVSYGIVQAHGGDIEVQSTVGGGTRFTVSLPLTQPQPETAAGHAGVA